MQMPCYIIMYKNQHNILIPYLLSHNVNLFRLHKIKLMTNLSLNNCDIKSDIPKIHIYLQKQQNVCMYTTHTYHSKFILLSFIATGCCLILIIWQALLILSTPIVNLLEEPTPENVAHAICKNSISSLYFHSLTISSIHLLVHTFRFLDCDLS